MTVPVRKAYAADMETLGPRTVRVICSTGDVDRGGEVVEQDGIDLSAYRANPIILFGHDPMHPVGVAKSIGVKEGKLQAEIEFAPEGVSAKADEVCALMKAGILKTVSIGFDPVESEPMTPGRPKGPQRYRKITLYEVSAVAIPANPEAVVVQRAKPEEPTDMTEQTPVTPTRRRKGLRQRAGMAPVVKDLYQVASLLYMLDQLGYQIDRARIEAALEGDGSTAAEVLHGIMQDLGAAILDCAREEIGEAIAGAAGSPEEAELDDLPEADAALIGTAKTPALARFRAGWLRTKAVAVVKEGKTISAATATTLAEALGHHDEAREHHRKAMKCMALAEKCIKDLLPEEGDEPRENVRVTQTSDGTGEDEGAEEKHRTVPVTKAGRLARAAALAA